LLCHYRYGVAHNLKKPTPYVKHLLLALEVNRQPSVPKERHERCVTGKDPHLPVESRRYHGIRLAVVHGLFR
jgi:hypothetical protein